MTPAELKDARRKRLSKARAVEMSKHLRTDMTDEDARDAVDLATGGELDAWQLDTLTDWAIAIVHQKPPEYLPTDKADPYDYRADPANWPENIR